MSVCVWGLWVIGQCRAFVCIIIKREREGERGSPRKRKTARGSAIKRSWMVESINTAKTIFPFQLVKL